MKVVQKDQSREAYIATQVERSNSKFHYCKVSIHDALKYNEIISRDLKAAVKGPVLCLGTRNGREVDMFRVGFFGNKVSRALSTILESRSDSFYSAFPFIEKIGRSDASHVAQGSVIGVEINPKGARKDVWVGSFDEMPKEWTQKFQVVYSNSFDQSQDPFKTAAEWKRVIAPGGYLVFCFDVEDAPSDTDPVGNLKLDDVLSLFKGHMVCFNNKGSKNGYSEAIIRF